MSKHEIAQGKKATMQATRAYLLTTFQHTVSEKNLTIVDSAGSVNTSVKVVLEANIHPGILKLLTAAADSFSVGFEAGQKARVNDAT